MEWKWGVTEACEIQEFVQAREAKRTSNSQDPAGRRRGGLRAGWVSSALCAFLGSFEASARHRAARPRPRPRRPIAALPAPRGPRGGEDAAPAEPARPAREPAAAPAPRAPTPGRRGEGGGRARPGPQQVGRPRPGSGGGLIAAPPAGRAPHPGPAPRWPLPVLGGGGGAGRAPPGARGGPGSRPPGGRLGSLPVSRGRVFLSPSLPPGAASPPTPPRGPSRLPESRAEPAGRGGAADATRKGTARGAQSPAGGRRAQGCPALPSPDWGRVTHREPGLLGSVNGPFPAAGSALDPGLHRRAGHALLI